MVQGNKYQIWIKAKYIGMYYGTIYRINDRQRWEYLRPKRWFEKLKGRAANIKIFTLSDIKNDYLNKDQRRF